MLSRLGNDYEALVFSF